MSKIPSPPSKWRVQLGVWEVVVFPVPKEIVYSLYNIRFYIFWAGINLTKVSQLGEENLVNDSFYTSKSLTLFQIWIFCYTFAYLSHLELSRIELLKLTPSILIEIVTIPVVLVDQFYFYQHQPIKTRLFEKIIFELDYH